MNILLLCGNLSYAGAQRQMFELSKGLNKNHNVIVCSITSNVPLLENYESENIDVRVFNLRKRNFFKITSNLKKIIKENKIDVLYSYLEVANTYSRFMKLFCPSIKVISSERNSDNIPSLKKKMFEGIFKHKTDIYIANSYAGKKDLENKYNIDNCVVVSNGVDTHRFSKNDNPSYLKDNFSEFLRIGMIARIKPQKNYEMFIEVADKVCELHKEVVFLAIGDQPNKNDNDYHAKILSLRDNAKNKDRIQFIGARSDIPQVLFDTDISILTSYREGCSNTVLESMFAKCPLVLTDVGDNRYMLSDSNKEYLVNPNDVENMVNKISELVSNESLRKKIGTDNHKRAYEVFTLDQMVKNTEQTILKLLKS